ncbi:MAG: DUF4920 domain-containing protein [Ignavibacteriae bacterium]|nr:DUF4920 domain-containing protein [Ignavibacteriota bacterium]NOG99059.1 DUF4920 domain-containing protein [Ignavibacteriota bacterium]
MFKSLLALFMILFVVSNLFASDGKTFGKDITEKETTKISTILETPEKYDGKVVKVEGTVVNVCESRGCWIEISSDKEYQTIKVKVDDGVIVFPMEAKGKPAVVQGEVYSFVPSIQSDCMDACGDKDKHAEAEKTEKAEKVEDGCCPSKKVEVKKVYQIKGHGAVISI